MKYTLFFLAFLLIGTPSFAQTEIGQRIWLPNGWALTPTGKQIPLGDLPLNMAVSPNKKWIAVTNNGQSKQTLEIIDAVGGIKTDTILIPKSWYGLVFGQSGNTLYASGGHDNMVRIYKVNAGKISYADSIKLGEKWPVRIGVAGMDVDESQLRKLFVVTREDSSLYVFDIGSKNLLNKVKVGSEAYTCKLSGDKKLLFISLWGDKKIAVYDVAAAKIISHISTGDHPNELLLSANGKLLFVANANDNSVNIIDTKTHQVIQTLNAALYPGAPAGSTSNGLALSEDGKTLYVANADNNCLAVFDVRDPRKVVSKGFIPTGWYPTNVKVIGRKIYVTNGKGNSSFANPNGPNPISKKQVVLRHAGDSSKPVTVQYIAGLFRGTMSIINEPNAALAAKYSKAVYENTPYVREQEMHAKGEPGNPIPSNVGDTSPIKHVFYIIKENRTYDQVLGDMPAGNGDTSLTLFGRFYTPNQHKIVDEFVLVDNFFVDAEVSADGHNWSMGAYATDYLEKTWPSSYGGRGGTYGGEGERAIANNPRGFIWDNAKRNNVTYRTYGEFTQNNKPTVPSLIGHVANYRGYDLSFRDTARFYQWKHDFDSLLAANAVPQLTTLRFGNDHTEGMRAGKPTPYAHVADNDLAVGMFIDYLSKSPIWKTSVVFILEDDAQNGPDHVDAHRSPLYVVGPYVKRRSTDHTPYTTSGVLRTIELILGMPPMTQYDAAATPLFRMFTSNPDYTPFTHLPSNVNLNDKNPGKTALSAQAEAYKWDKEDAVPDLVFNDMLWLGLKGIKAPAPVRAAFLRVDNKKKDDDD